MANDENGAADWARVLDEIRIELRLVVTRSVLFPPLVSLSLSLSLSLLLWTY